MVTFFSTTLVIAILGLTGLIAAKRRESTTGRVFFSGVRPVAGHLLGKGLHFVERRAPALVRLGFSTLIAAAKTGIRFSVAWVVLRAERLLEKTLHTLRHTTATRGEGEASPFLREVAEHKKSLQEGTDRKQNAIYEE